MPPGVHSRPGHGALAPARLPAPPAALTATKPTPAHAAEGVLGGEPFKCAGQTVQPFGVRSGGIRARRACSRRVAYLCGVKEVEQLPVRLSSATDTDTFTVYPGVAPLM